VLYGVRLGYEFGFVSVTDMLELLIVKDNFYGIQLKVNHKNDKIG
jgi:hypothetical protein